MTSPNAGADRRAMLAKIAIARKQLALHEDSYRAILMRITGAESAASLGPSQLDAVLAEFKRLGWKAKKGTGRPMSAEAQVRMIRAVWADIRPHLTSGGDEAALRAFVRRQTRTEARPEGIDNPEWLRGSDANRVLEGLKAWRARVRKQAAERASAAARLQASQPDV